MIIRLIRAANGIRQSHYCWIHKQGNGHSDGPRESNICLGKPFHIRIRSQFDVIGAMEVLYLQGVDLFITSHQTSDKSFIRLENHA